MKINVRNVKLAWKYRRTLWRYRKLIRHRRAIVGWAAVSAAFATGILFTRYAQRT